MNQNNENGIRIRMAIDVIEQLSTQLKLRVRANNKKKHYCLKLLTWFSDLYDTYRIDKFIKEANEFKDLLINGVFTFEDEIDALNMFNHFLILEKEFLIKMLAKVPLSNKEDPEDLYNIFTYGGVV